MTPRQRPLVIAVDGPAAAGKGTLARRIADHLGFPYLDTGLLYRCVAAKLLRAGETPEDAAAAAAAAGTVRLDELDASDLRSEEAARAASKVAAIPGVRTALLEIQRRFAAQPGGAVLDGRDIGTVVCPGAPVKIFMTASPEVRAKRRALEIAQESLGVNELIGAEAERIYARVLQDMVERDRRDSARAVAPLVPAPDAFVIDSSALDPDGAFAAALAHISASGVLDPA
jgi:cytidylate kinase